MSHTRLNPILADPAELDDLLAPLDSRKTDCNDMPWGDIYLKAHRMAEKARPVRGPVSSREALFLCICEVAERVSRHKVVPQ